MKLREFKFNDLKSPFRLTGLCIRKDNKTVAEGPIGEVLRKQEVIDLADAEIKETRWFFDEFVIEV